MDKLILTTTEVAAYTGMHRNTVLAALESGHLHGMQPRVNCTWRIRRECVDAWLSGEKCEHQRHRAA